MPRGHPKPSQNRLRATRLSKVPRSVDVSQGHTEGGHPRPAISPSPRGHPRFDSNSFFGCNSAQEARRRKRSVFRDARPPGQPQQLPDAHRRQQWRPRPTKSSFTAFTLASRRGATTHGYQASISYLLTNSSTTYIHTSAYTV